MQWDSQLNIHTRPRVTWSIENYLEYWKNVVTCKTDCSVSILRQHSSIRKPIRSRSITWGCLPVSQRLIAGQSFRLENLYSFPTMDIPRISCDILFSGRRQRVVHWKNWKFFSARNPVKESLLIEKGCCWDVRGVYYSGWDSAKSKTTVKYRSFKEHFDLGGFPDFSIHRNIIINYEFIRPFSWIIPFTQHEL